MLAFLLVASHTYYAAAVATFGCTSSEEVVELRHLQTNGLPFEKELYGQIFQGQCVNIPKGTIVEGSVRKEDPQMLVIDRQIIPPGYIAPLADFELTSDRR